MKKKMTIALLSLMAAFCVGAGFGTMNAYDSKADTEETHVVFTETKYKVSTDKQKMLLVTAMSNYSLVYEVGYEIKGYTVSEEDLADTTKYYDAITTGTKTEDAGDIFGSDYEGYKLVIWEVAYAETATFNVYALEGEKDGDMLVLPETEKKTTGAERTKTQDPVVEKYTVTFKNGDDVLQSGEVEKGETPEYTGATPTKAEDEQYTYTFKGWTPAIVAATEDAVYTAEFESVKKQGEEQQGVAGVWEKGFLNWFGTYELFGTNDEGILHFAGDNTAANIDRKQYVYVEHVSGKNVLTFELKSLWAGNGISLTEAIQLGLNNNVYTYNTMDNKWHDKDGVANDNIVMTEGNDGWSVFTVKGVITNVEIIINCAGLKELGKTDPYAGASYYGADIGYKDNAVWTYEEIAEPEEVAGTLKNGYLNWTNRGYGVFEDLGNGVWDFATDDSGDQTRYVYVEHVEGKNVLTFAIRSTWSCVPNYQAIKLGYNGNVYYYDKDANVWKDASTGAVNNNIMMTDENGTTPYNYGTITADGDNWPWTVFTIKGITTKVDLIVSIETITTRSPFGLGADMNIKDIAWTYEEIEEPEEPTEVAGTLKYGRLFFNKEGGVFGEHDTEDCLRFAGYLTNGYEDQYVYVEYVENKNVLSFEMKTLWSEIPLHVAIKLGFNGHVYTYNTTDNKWYDENGVVNEDIITTDKNGNAVALKDLTVVDGGYPWTVFTIKGVSTDVKLILNFAAIQEHGGYKTSFISYTPGDDVGFRNAVWTDVKKK